MIPEKGKYYKCISDTPIMGTDNDIHYFIQGNVYLSKQDYTLVCDTGEDYSFGKEGKYFEEHFEEATPDVVDAHRRLNKVQEGLVDHPLHYNSHPSGIECIEIARHYCFAVGNAIKYLWRAGLKQEVGKSDATKEIEDLEKAKWYIDDRIKQLKAEQNN